MQANYTYADAKETGNRDLVGASKNTYNIVGYYENYGFSARLAYTYRSHSSSASTAARRSTRTTPARSPPRSATQLNKNVTLTFDALNLNDPTLKYYGANTASRARSTRTDGSSLSICFPTKRTKRSASDISGSE